MNQQINRSLKSFCFIALGIIFFLSSCLDDDDVIVQNECLIDPAVKAISSRDFKMGFSTWTYGPNIADRNNTYQYIQANGDIYSEQIDDRIPWSAWINNEALPADFVENIDYRVSKRDENMNLLLSVSLLNTDRNDLIEDWEEIPLSFSSWSDQHIEDAYIAHLSYLIDRFQPDYLVLAMEVNDLLIASPSRWFEYKLLMSNVRSSIKQQYPNIRLSESITLHNLYQPEVVNPTAYINEITTYAQESDFAAISFYPFFKGLQSGSQFQKAFDFLHTNIDIPIAFVETNHLAEDLNVPNLSLNIRSDECLQQIYLETLLKNAHTSDYAFIIWWAHRDYDALWNTFPDDVKDIGQVWRDTGLLDEGGNERSALEVWQHLLDK